MRKENPRGSATTVILCTGKINYALGELVCSAFEILPFSTSECLNKYNPPVVCGPANPETLFKFRRRSRTRINKVLDVAQKLQKDPQATRTTSRTHYGPRIPRSLCIIFFFNRLCHAHTALGHIFQLTPRPQSDYFHPAIADCTPEISNFVNAIPLRQMPDDCSRTNDLRNCLSCGGITV